MNRLKKEIREFSVLLNCIPSPLVTFFSLSVVVMNLLANKELFNCSWLALDCGFAFSWVSFLCMDIICKVYGAKAANRVTVFAMITNLVLFVFFNLLAKTPGHWGEFYTTGMVEIDNALDATIAGSWFIVIGSSIALVTSGFVNSVVNTAIGKLLANSSFKDFAIRSFTSTFIGQFVDNLVFATLVSVRFFGWTWLQVFTCSLTGAVAELLFEVVFSPLGYRAAKKMEKTKEIYQKISEMEF